MHQNFKDQRLIGGSRRGQAFGAVEGALVLKHGPCEGELPWPVNAPAPREVILLPEASDGEVTGGQLQFLDFDAVSTRWDGDNRIIFVCFMLVEVQAFIKLAS